MLVLEGERLLRAWDSAIAMAEVHRAPQLLAIACPPTTVADWSAASLLDLNLNLLRLRKMSFGSHLAGYLPCPACNTRLEFGFDIGAAIQHLEILSQRTTANFQIAGEEFSMRRLSIGDLLHTRGERNLRKAELTLLKRSIASTRGRVFDAQILTEESETVVTEIFTELNDGAEIICQGSCMECGRSHRFDLDIARFFWSEVRYRALNLMRDVDELASSYGWSEQAILAMSPQRRRQYTEMIHA